MTRETMTEIWATLVSQMRGLLDRFLLESEAQRLATLQWEAVILHIRSALVKTVRNHSKCHYTQDITTASRNNTWNPTLELSVC